MLGLASIDPNWNCPISNSIGPICVVTSIKEKTRKSRLSLRPIFIFFIDTFCYFSL